MGLHGTEPSIASRLLQRLLWWKQGANGGENPGQKLKRGGGKRFFNVQPWRSTDSSGLFVKPLISLKKKKEFAFGRERSCVHCGCRETMFISARQLQLCSCCVLWVKTGGSGSCFSGSLTGWRWWEHEGRDYIIFAWLQLYLSFLLPPRKLIPHFFQTSFKPSGELLTSKIRTTADTKTIKKPEESFFFFFSERLFNENCSFVRNKLQIYWKEAIARLRNAFEMLLKWKRAAAAGSLRLLLLDLEMKAWRLVGGGDGGLWKWITERNLVNESHASQSRYAPPFQQGPPDSTGWSAGLSVSNQQSVWLTA